MGLALMGHVRERLCGCFGNTELHGGTYMTEDGRERCDVCELPVRSGDGVVAMAAASEGFSRVISAYVVVSPRGNLIRSTIRPDAEGSWEALVTGEGLSVVDAARGWRVRRLSCVAMEFVE